MLKLQSGWRVHTDYSTEWLFFRIEHAGGDGGAPTLSESIWSDAQKHDVKRLVCELGQSVWMNSYLIGQIMRLHKRTILEGGTLRFCGLNDEKHGVLRMMGLGERFPNYATREDAVMGHRPA